MPASHRPKLRSSESVQGTRVCGVGCGVVRRGSCGLARKWLFFSFEAGKVPASHRPELRSSVERARHAGLWRGCGVVRRESCGLAHKWLFFSFEAGMECGLHAYPVEMRFSGEADGIL